MQQYNEVELSAIGMAIFFILFSLQLEVAIIVRSTTTIWPPPTPTPIPVDHTPFTVFLSMLLSIVRFGFVVGLGQEKPVDLRFKYLLGQVRALGMLAGGTGITPMFQIRMLAISSSH
ncbi:NADH--cytochrome b5 reductase 1 [Camellia lanceoleosa]|uniref:NADH--cytochrome b5 reductase 1 n=1 Tax=Camellia lanceoleosa TaxID=1840588 RepID=A0ACC0HYA4_9ERIC|nr:NADH--cytochrome b5 reductase 1 [Camellia lanceoleosa]